MAGKLGASTIGAVPFTNGFARRLSAYLKVKNGGIVMVSAIKVRPYLLVPDIIYPAGTSRQ